MGKHFPFISLHVLNYNYINKNFLLQKLFLNFLKSFRGYLLNKILYVKIHLYLYGWIIWIYIHIYMDFVDENFSKQSIPF